MLVELFEYSDIAVFSFSPVKIITISEGGACLTNDMALYEKCISRSHGIVRIKRIYIKNMVHNMNKHSLDLITD